MPRLITPGVFIEETSTTSQAIEGVTTAVTAFIGITSRNSLSKPKVVKSMADYLDSFGPIFSSDDVMALAVNAFFLNGGRTAYICPVASGAETASLVLGGMTILAKDSGSWGNHLFIRIMAPNIADNVFNLAVGTQDDDGRFTAREKFKDVSLNKMAPGFVGKAVNKFSTLISIKVNDADSLPSITDDNGLGLIGGETNPPALHTYTRFFDKVLRNLAINIIVLPGQCWSEDGTGNAVISIAQAHCDKLKNRMLIIDPPETLALRDESAVRRMALPTSDYTVFYYPWVGMANSLFHQHTNRTVSKTVNVAPSAIAAGIWSKIDERRGVWKSPAGLQLAGASSLVFDVTRFEQQQLNPLSVNCIRKFPRRGIMLWGARTLSSNPEWRYISVRRLAIFIEESINKSIEWVVFEPNDEPLWLSLRAIVDEFMFGLFREGALQGSTAEEAFFVRVGLGNTMTQSDIEQGRLIIDIGFAPLKPAEFVIVRIKKKVVGNN